ncbi:MAG TPA: hypothetical protein VFT50_01545 [Baekduia sp.]|nr:hypothetical protein [Baekduia sp.]
MNVRRTALISSAVLALGAGAGVAVAATSGDDGKQAEDAVLSDAAKRLNVSPDQLRSALGAAEDAQLDQAVKDGKLTQQQADAIKAHRQQDGRVLGPVPGAGPMGRHGGPWGGPGVRGPGGPMGAGLDAAAKALGLQRDALLTQLRAGKSLADVAKAQGKSADDVKAAIRTAVTQQLDAAVKAKRLTADQRQHVLDDLDEHLDDLVNGSFDGPPRGPHGPGPHGPGPDGMMPPAGGAQPRHG